MLIRIKRSANNTFPANIDFGELAYSSNAEILFIGDDNDEVISIGGKKTPGITVPNSDVVADSQGKINFINVGNTYATRILASDSFGNQGDIFVYNANTNSLNWEQPIIQEDYVFTYINFFFPYYVSANSNIINYPVGLTYTLLENFQDSVAYTENPAQTTSQIFSIIKNNTAIGTVTFDVGQSEGTFSPLSQEVFGRNVDILKIKSISNTDTSFKNFTISLKFIKKYPNEYIPPLTEGNQSFLFWNNKIMYLNTNPLIYEGNV